MGQAVGRLLVTSWVVPLKQNIDKKVVGAVVATFENEMEGGGGGGGESQ